MLQLFCLVLIVYDQLRRNELVRFFRRSIVSVFSLDFENFRSERRVLDKLDFFSFFGLKLIRFFADIVFERPISFLPSSFFSNNNK